MAEDQGDVAILFCDICNFDSLLQNQEMQNIVLTIDKTFREFDEICMNMGVQKIEVHTAQTLSINADARPLERHIWLVPD